MPETHLLASVPEQVPEQRQIGRKSTYTAGVGGIRVDFALHACGGSALLITHKLKVSGPGHRAPTAQLNAFPHLKSVIGVGA